MNSRNLALASRRHLRAKLGRYIAQCGVFFRGFLEHPRMVGSIIPSSRFTVRRMLAPVDWRECRLFVEYGPGIGTFCRPVLEKMSGDATLIVIDTNPIYIDFLNQTIRDKRFHAVLGSAEDVAGAVAYLVSEDARYVTRWCRPGNCCSHSPRSSPRRGISGLPVYRRMPRIHAAAFCANRCGF